MRREHDTHKRFPLSVLLVEDAVPVRQRLYELITEVPILRVAAEAGSVAEANTLFDILHPEAVLLDLALPGGSGTDVIRHIREGNSCQSVIVVLSNYLEPEMYNHCSELGADFLFSKSDEFEQAIETLRSLAERETLTSIPERGILKRRATLSVTSPIGMHARAAVMLVQQAQGLDADIEISYEGNKTSAKSFLGVLSLSVEYGTQVTVTATGPDADKAIRAITRMFACGFDEPPLPGAREMPDPAISSNCPEDPL